MGKRIGIAAVAAMCALGSSADVSPARTPDVELLGELVGVRSISRDIGAVNRAERLVKGWLEARGIACAVETMPDGHEIVYASTKPGKMQDVILATHLDTVPADDGDRGRRRTRTGRMGERLLDRRSRRAARRLREDIGEVRC